MNNEVKQLNEYQTDLLKNNKQKEEQERGEMEKQFQYRLKAANENINNHYLNKQKERDQRNQEKYKFSPENLSKTKTQDLQGQTVTEDGLSQGQTSTFFSTMKPPTPKYNDFLNTVFAKKQHQSYKLGEKTELRTKIILDKFKDQFYVGMTDLDKRIQEDYVKRTVEFAKTQDDRRTKRDNEALAAQEFQLKQMKERKLVEESDKKDLEQEFLSERVVMEKIDM